MPSTLQRILIVEDDLDIQAIARFALERVGKYTVEVCSRGDEALEKATHFAPDFILLDIMMPGMDGVETLEALRSRPETATVPVAFCTAKAQKHEVDAYKALGVADVICKPFDAMTLAATINEIWEARDG